MKNRSSIFQYSKEFESNIRDVFAYTLMSTGSSMTDRDKVPNVHIEIAEAFDEIAF